MFAKESVLGVYVFELQIVCLISISLPWCVNVYGDSTAVRHTSVLL